jgi:hypothetical protein
MKNTAQFFRDSCNAMKRAILEEITNVLLKESDNKLVLYDHHGNLVVNVINNLESEVIMSIYLKYQTNNPPQVMVAGGVYEEDWNNPLEDYSYEKIIDVLDAVEIASEDIKRDTKLDELESAEKN